MDHDPKVYESLVEDAGIDSESLTIVLVAGGSRAEVLRLLRADPEGGQDPYDVDDEDHSAYAAAEVAGGVVAIEHTGYADPSPRVLAELSALGGAAAVTRGNIQAHERFGCARDGAVLFDADEFMFVDEEEKESLPSELRPLFDAAWIDLDADDADEDDGGDESKGFIALAMAAKFTGVGITSGDLVRAIELGYHRAPSLTYLE